MRINLFMEVFKFIISGGGTEVGLKFNKNALEGSSLCPYRMV